MEVKSGGQEAEIEVSMVMPCLNERDTIGTCIGKAQRAMKELGVQGEVMVADNGSTDGSVAIAEDWVQGSSIARLLSQ